MLFLVIKSNSAFVPLGIAFVSKLVDFPTFSVLAAFEPVALAPTPVHIVHHASAMLLVIEESPLVAPAVWIEHLAVSLHLVGLPFADIDASVCPCVLTMPLNVVVVEVTLVLGPISPRELTIAMLAPFVICSSI